MSNQVINFTFENLPVRIIDQKGDFWFVANDVCKILELTNPRQALTVLDDDEKADVSLTDISSNGVEQSRKVNIINESGLYALILRSRKAMQKGTVQHKFRKWVTSEVLPSIRKTGQYRHTISETQAHAISKAVKQKCQHNSHHYQTLYHALYDEFGITSYKELLASDFPRAMAFISSFALASDNNAFWRAVGLLEYERMSHELLQLQRQLDDICQAMHKFNRSHGLVYDALAEQQVVSTADTYASAKAFIANQHLI